jgi:hypothetical protein
LCISIFIFILFVFAFVCSFVRFVPFRSFVRCHVHAAVRYRAFATVPFCVHRSALFTFAVAPGFQLFAFRVLTVGSFAGSVRVHLRITLFFRRLVCSAGSRCVGSGFRFPPFSCLTRQLVDVILGELLG